MKQISNKEFEKYKKYLSDKANSRILTQEGIRFICSSHHYDPVEIGHYFLELLPTLPVGCDNDPDEDDPLLASNNWLQAETDEELNELLDMFWGFHDFKIEKVDYSSAPDRVDLLLEYDTHEFHVLLRFIGNISMNFIPVQDYAVDWLTGATLGKNEHGQIIWAGDEDIATNDLPMDVLWIKGTSLRYALLDENGHPKRLPEDLVHQVFQCLNIDTGKYEDTDKQFHPHYCSTK